MTGSSRINRKEVGGEGEKDSLYKDISWGWAIYNKIRPHILVVEGNPEKSITLIFNFRKGNSKKNDIISKEKLQIKVNNSQDVLKLFRNILKPGVNLGPRGKKKENRVNLKEFFIANW